MNAAIEDTVVKAARIDELKRVLAHPSVDQIEIALHVFSERKRDLSEKGAMRIAIQAAFAPTLEAFTAKESQS